MSKQKPKGYTGNRGVGGEVTVSFMCSEDLRRRLQSAAAWSDVSASEFIRNSIEESLKGFGKGNP